MDRIAVFGYVTADKTEMNEALKNGFQIDDSNLPMLLFDEGESGIYYWKKMKTTACPHCFGVAFEEYLNGELSLWKTSK